MNKSEEELDYGVEGGMTFESGGSADIPSQSRHIYVLGNGSSLKGFDFSYLKDKEWIGTCVAFRYWEEIVMYPTHYVCVDNAVCKKHLNSIKNMIINKKCDTFLLCASIIQEWPDIQQYKEVMYSPLYLFLNHY